MSTGSDGKTDGKIQGKDSSTNGVTKSDDNRRVITLSNSVGSTGSQNMNALYDEEDISFKQLMLFGNRSLYSYVILIIIGVILAGQGFSTNSVLLGYSVDIFLNYESLPNGNGSTDRRSMDLDEKNSFLSQVMNLFFISLLFSIAALIGAYIMLYYSQLFMIVLSRKMREIYFRNIVGMEIAWHDRQNTGEFASRIATDFRRFENGLNENFAIFLYHTVGGVMNIVGAFFYGWKLTLAVVSVLPIILISSYLMSKCATYYQTLESRANNHAGGAVEEAVFSIRTVFAFGAQMHELLRYEKKLHSGMSSAYKRHITSAIASAINWMMTYVAIAVTIYVGVHLLLDDHFYTPGKIVIVYWCINGCAYNISCAAPHFEALNTGRGSLKSIFHVLNNVSSIDPRANDGLKLTGKYKTDIEFHNVTFAYPTRPQITILKNLNLRIREGEIVALVGASGSGKSTIIQLIQRFYDPSDGCITINGFPLKDLNVGWLRQQIGVVGQEPVLFNDTIEGNIKLGLPKEQMYQVTMEKIVESGKMANAHEFISNLKDGYGTMVGDRGAQLSGGQKQRIAIARALISNPRILLLDEATSALDIKSELVVQEALDRASLGRTTIIVAHRLSTIINADRIVVFDKGVIIEMGNHQQLMDKKGAYYKLVETQQLAQPEVMAGISPMVPKQPLPTNDNQDQVENECLRMEPEQHFPLSAIPVPHRVLSIGQNEGLTRDEIETEQNTSFPYKRVGAFLWRDKWLLMAAIVCSIGVGFIIPIYAILVGDFIDEFRDKDKIDNRDYMNGRAVHFTVLFLIMAVIVGVLCVVQVTFFGIAGEKLTKRLRILAYGSVLSQEIQWFDEPSNSTGRICSKLADDASNIQAATGLRISLICQATSTMLASVAIGFFYSWQLAGLSLLIMPFVIFVGFKSANVNAVQNQSSSKSVQKTVKIMMEVLSSIRTVASLHKEEYFVEQYAKQLAFHSGFVRTTVSYKSMMMAMALTAELFAYTFSFLAGGYVMTITNTRASDFFRVVESMIFGSAVIGECAILSTDFIRAKIAAVSIFQLIDSAPPDSKLTKHYENKYGEYGGNGNGNKSTDGNDNRNKKTGNEESTSAKKRERPKGYIEFKDVHFSYPSRADQSILKGLNFKAAPGQTVALVGASGCGKSTTIQLLEMFYKPTFGQIKLDDKSIHSTNRDWVRKQFALVSQEPALFNYSIAQNIAYGDITRKVTMSEIVRVAKMANVDEFIEKFPQGYDTMVGSKGAQLSGGQKQRIAIARALIRDPPILLLDEATSALDSASEAVVQKALDQASKGRTCLVIAHRLRTILNAHKIVVFNRGVVVEEGTHEELLEKRSYYYALYTAAFSKH